MEGDDTLLLLPPEIWSEIFIRLPTESILRCKYACKSWHSLISNPNSFSNNKSDNRILLKLYDDRTRSHKCSLISRDESFLNPRKHDDDVFPKQFLGRNLQIVASCDGLICLADIMHGKEKTYTHVEFLIWNPAIGKIVELPTQSCDYRSFYYGFGFDYKTSDHKVLFNCEVFDLKKGVWRNIDDPNLYSCVIKREAQCYLNGAAHWIGRSRWSRYESCIIAFSMSDEVFRKITMPDCYCSKFIHVRSTNAKIVVLGGLICVVEWETREDDLMGKLESYSVWAMSKYGVAESWSKVFDVEYPSDRVLTSKRFWPYMFLWENGEVGMATCDREVDKEGGFEHEPDLVLYNRDGRKFKFPFCFSVNEDFADFCFYKESLVLM